MVTTSRQHDLNHSIEHLAMYTISGIMQGLKRGLVVSKRLIKAHIRLIVNLIRAS